MHRLRNLVHKLGYDLVRIKPNQIGRDSLNDMSIFTHNDQPTIFDIGANTGQSIHTFRSRFPKSKIHSFEPSPTTFEILKQQESDKKDIHLWNCGMGSTTGEMTFLENSNSTMSSFLPLGKVGWGEVEKETIVEVKTIDQFCLDENIEKIDILKSDTQGFELEVFKGANNSIQENKIGLIYCEMIFSDMYENLPPFTKTYDYLTNNNFSLVSFYQTYYQNQLASWTDALFVHDSYNTK